MKILHLCWGLSPNNGAANIARMIMREQIDAGHEARMASRYSREEIAECDEFWCHCGWYWRIWIAVWRAKRMGKRVKWMPECCYDPLRLAYHGWKKTLVGAFERWALRRVDAIVATCEEEGAWCHAYIGKKCPLIEVTDIKRFFKFREAGEIDQTRALHVLYLGRRHPLKGVEYLEEAVNSIPRCDLRIVSDHTGEELEQDWAWCDVLCLPTLSENFGLVVAEALERGKRVVTTDGAPAWRGQEGVVYIEGFVAASPEAKVDKLREAISGVRQSPNSRSDLSIL